MKTKLHKIAGSLWFAGLFVIAGYTLKISIGPRTSATVHSDSVQVSRSMALAADTVAASPLALERAVPVSEAIRKVMPELAAVPNDWRNYNPDQITVELAHGVVVAFQKVSVSEKDGRIFWTGKSSVDSGQIFAVATKGSWFAAVNFVHGNDYMVRVAGQGAAITEAAPEDFQCADFENVTALASVVTAVAAASPAKPDANGVYTVDVAVFYDNDCMTAANTQIQNMGLSVTAMEYFTSTVLAYFQYANGILINSQVTNLRWSCLGFYNIPAYSINGDTSFLTDLAVMSQTTTSAGQFVQQTMDTFAADQAVLYVGTTRDFGGRAYSPGHHVACVFPSLGGTLAHEMAHNFGCHHDRITESAVDSDGHYYYGNRWTDSTGKDTGDIMSYATYHVPYFGNPAVSVDGFPTGVAAGQSKAADCARVLRENAANMASYKSPMLVPEITTQPTGVSVGSGTSFSLTVVADGGSGSLGYHWYKDGAPVTGTSDTFTKIATITDAGSYTVTVTNTKGSVTSSPATVSVSAPPPAPSTGGGGGAPGLFFYVALLTITLNRFVAARRNKTWPSRHSAVL